MICAAASGESCLDDKVSLVQLGSRLTTGRSAKMVIPHPEDGPKACGESLAIKDSKMALPARGFVTCCNTDISKEDMFNSIVAYLKAGGRLIDTAPVYGYQETVGKAIHASGVPREDIWVSSMIDTDGWRALLGSPKLWALDQVRKNLHVMNLSYVDSMTLHAGTAQVAMEADQPVGSNTSKWHTLSPADHVDMWQALIEAKKHGQVRHLGVCLTSRLEIENLIQETGEKPSIVMAWFNPWMPKAQKKFVSWAQSQDMAVLAYGLFNFKNMPEGKEKKAITRAAERHNVTYGQVAIRWALDQGVGFISGMYHPEYLKEDLPCLDFEMEAADHELLQTTPEWECNLQYKTDQFFSGCIP